MKPLLLLVIISFQAIAVKAQLNKIDVQKFNNDSSDQKLMIQQFKTMLIRKGKTTSLSYSNEKPLELFYSVRSKTIGVMRCLNPNTKETAAIPNG